MADIWEVVDCEFDCPNCKEHIKFKISFYTYLNRKYFKGCPKCGSKYSIECLLRQDNGIHKILRVSKWGASEEKEHAVENVETEKVKEEISGTSNEGSVD